jgi:hypothetical protein
MPRFVLAFVLFACTFYGASIDGTSAGAATSELSRCLDASTVLGAGGDVSDQDLKAAQSACAQLKQSSPDRDTLRRVNAAAETINEEVQRRGGTSR